MVKKTISVLLVLIMVFTIMMPINVNGISKDFGGHWAEDVIQSWLDDGNVIGYPDGTFKPEGSVTRAEFIKMVNKIFEFNDITEISFTDVNKNDWYYEEVQKAYKENYISGISETLFAPNEVLTREQASVIVSKIMKLERSSGSAEIFTDSNKISAWAKEFISSAAASNLIKGYDDNSFKPQNPITRAEAIVTLSRAIGENYLVWNIGRDPMTWDPTINSETSIASIIQNMFEGLTRETADGIRPAAAKSWDISEDGKTYVFHLRENLKWSDGKPLTAHDFEYAWKRACDPLVASDYSFLVTNYIENGEEYFKGEAKMDEVGVKAFDDLTLEVHLKNPTPYFLNLVSMQTYMPVRQDIVEAYDYGWEKNPKTCISNGPFKLSDYKEGFQLTMVKNENYWDKENIKLNGIKGLMVDGVEALDKYKNGDIQVIDNIDADQIPTIKEDSNFKIYPNNGTYYVQFNVDNEIFDDARVRKAFSLAIDRTKLVEEAIKGVQIPATGLVPAGMIYSDGTSVRQMDANGVLPEFSIDPNKALVEEAQALLAEAGYPNGKGLPEITYSYNTNEMNKKIAEALQSMWKENLNVDVKLINQDWAVYHENRRNGEFMITRGGWIGDYGDPMTMLEVFTTYSGVNDPQWRYKLNPIIAPHDNILNKEQEAYEKAILDSNLLIDSERDQKLIEAENILMDNMVIAPIYYYTISTIVDKTKVEGVELTITNKWDFRNANLIK